MAAEILRQEEFEGVLLNVIEEGGEEWFTAEDIGKGLGFSEPRKSILNLNNRNKDELGDFHRVISLMTRAPRISETGF